MSRNKVSKRVRKESRIQPRSAKSQPPRSVKRKETASSISSKHIRRVPQVIAGDVLQDQARTCIEQIRQSAIEDAALYACWQQHRTAHLNAIGCTTSAEIEEYDECSRTCLLELYQSASRPNPSPARLMSLAIRYALDPRQSIVEKVSRFECRRGDDKYEIAEYPAGVIKVSAIPHAGKIIRDQFAVRILDCLLQDPPQLYRLRAFIELVIGDAVDHTAVSRKLSNPSISYEDIQVDLELSKARLFDEWHSLELPQAYFLKALIDARGQWLSGSDLNEHVIIGSRPDRVCKKLPSCFQSFVERQSGKGYRLRV